MSKATCICPFHVGWLFHPPGVENGQQLVAEKLFHLCYIFRGYKSYSVGYQCGSSYNQKPVGRYKWGSGNFSCC